MIKSLQGIDPRTAAGIMAETALSLGYADIPSLKLAKASVIRSVISDVRKQLGIASNDDAQGSLERIAAFLDEESDRILEPRDQQSALRRLAERGDLPSDLYEVDCDDNIERLYGSFFPLEAKIIKKTVTDFDKEQHYGRNEAEDEPEMLSLFVRTFRTKWRLKDFVVIVSGHRDGFKLHVNQAWRLYGTHISLNGLTQPMDILRKFANDYGEYIEINGQRGSFFLDRHGALPEPSYKNVKHRIFATRTVKRQIGSSRSSSILVSINASKYLNVYKQMHVKEEDMLDSFDDAKLGVPPLRARGRWGA